MQSLRGRGAVPGGGAEQSLREVAAERGAVVPAVLLVRALVARARQAPARGRRGRRALRGRAAHEERAGDGAEAPHVGCAVGASLAVSEHAGVGVRRRLLLDDPVVRVQDGREAEIAHLDHGVRQLGGELQAAGPEVPVVHVHRMAVGQRQHRLAYVLGTCLLLEPVPLVEALHPILNVAALRELEEDEEIVVVLHHVEDAAYVRVLELLQRLQLGQHVSRPPHRRPRDRLARAQLPGGLLSDHLDCAERPLADVVLEDVLPLEGPVLQRHGAPRPSAGRGGRRRAPRADLSA
mmetsp:Transcript_64755/g.174963  ORF Transcript_64755/g.174963 Transcript_64755/m.174963 type:complete len:293 (+) Transcript_64755:899-1777(+)